MEADKWPTVFGVYLYNIGGKHIKLGRLTVVNDTTVRAIAEKPEYAEPIAIYMAKAGWGPSEPIKAKWMRCQSRKRYIRLLMSTGHSPRRAALDAEFTRTGIKLGYIKSYQEAWTRQIASRVYAERPEQTASLDRASE